MDRSRSLAGSYSLGTLYMAYGTIALQPPLNHASGQFRRVGDAKVHSPSSDW